RRSIMRLVALLFAVSVISVSLGRGRGFATIVGFFATVGTAMAVLFAPQVLRIDMRQDLRHLELLKTWPVTAAAVVRGQLLWPGALITACAWALLAVALTMSGLVFTKLGWGWRVSARTRAGHAAAARARRDGPAPDHAGRNVAAAGGRCDAGGDRRRDCLVRVSLDDR